VIGISASRPQWKDFELSSENAAKIEAPNYESSAAPLEGERLPDLETFRKICAWLRVDPTDILGLPNNTDQPSPSDPDNFSVAAVHLRAEKIFLR